MVTAGRYPAETKRFHNSSKGLCIYGHKGLSKREQKGRLNQKRIGIKGRNKEGLDCRAGCMALRGFPGKIGLWKARYFETFVLFVTILVLLVVVVLFFFWGAA